MSAAELAALIGAGAALLTAAGAFLAVVGHLLAHKRADQQDAQAGVPGKDAGAR